MGCSPHPCSVLLGMGRFLAYADLQATDGHERCFADPTKSLQLWRVEKFYADLLHVYKEQDCDGLWDAGDTTDDRSSLPVPVINAVLGGLEKFPASPNHLKVIGNHEQYLRDSSIDVGRMFSSFFQVVSALEVIEFENVNILMCSFLEEAERIVKFLRYHRRKNKPAILLGHFQVAGAQMAAGTALAGVPSQEMEFVELGLLGHVHRPQSFGAVHYIGSPFQQHWGEANESKRVAIVDTDAMTVAWVPLPGFPVYRTVSLEQWKTLNSADSEDRFKVVLRGPAETEEFYAHPLFNRAEAAYAYSLAPLSAQGEASAIPRTKQEILSEYLRRNPPGERNIILDEQTMLLYADKISTAET